jgi:beta-galactosidase
MHIRTANKKLIICAVLIFQYGALFCQVRTVTGLNQYWQFTKGRYKPDGASDKAIAWETVSLPHTWNKNDVTDDTPDYYRAACWYRKNIAISSSLKNKNVYLYFEGANQQTTVYVNGKKAGSHIGGYTAFCVQIDQYLNFDAPDKNEIAVAVDNSFNENIPPLTADFTFYGGIYRNVNLITTNKVHFDMSDGAGGVYVSTPQVSAAKALVKVRGKLIKYAGFKNRLRIETTVLDADGKSIAVKANVISKDNAVEYNFVQEIPEIRMR